MKVKFKKLHPDAKIPTQGSEFAGGWDVYCTDIIQEEPDFVICKLGFSLQPPNGFKVTLVPRSSLTSTRWIQQNSPGLGDPDYLGEYQYRFRAIPEGWYQISSIEPFVKPKSGLFYPEFPYKVGDRIGQIYLEEIIPLEFLEVDELTQTQRGTDGFGSTGK